MPNYRTAFISHAHADNVRCARIADALKARGVDAWIDLNNAQVAHDLSAEINDELEQRTAFVLMVTETSNRSYWVRLERGAYISLLSTPASRYIKGVERVILPVRLSDDVPALLRGILWIDAVGKPDEVVADEIAAALLIATDPPIITDRRDPPPPPSSEWEEIPIPSGLYRLDFRGWRVRQTGVEFILPPTYPVAAGAFDMGSADSDTEAYDDEKPQYRIPVGAFAIGKYPITVAEYASYLKANPGVAVPSGNDDDFYGWKQQQSRPDHPIVCVTWFNARDYAAWLAQITGQPWRLPTEAEWEKAARWDEAKQHARIYPWGDAFDASRCNTADAQGKARSGKTTPIGSYPAGASPYGAQDMAGNVWEWLSSLYKEPYPYDQAVSEILENRTGDRVLRGGSWLSPLGVRAACRGRSGSVSWLSDRGVRVARGVGAGTA